MHGRDETAVRFCVSETDRSLSGLLIKSGQSAVTQRIFGSENRMKEVSAYLFYGSFGDKLGP